MAMRTGMKVLAAAALIAVCGAAASAIDKFVKVDGTVYPKLTLDSVARWIQEGRLLETDEIAPEGTSDYRKAVEYPEIKPYFDQFFGSPAVQTEAKKKGFFGKLFSFKK